jgi:glycyl-tRNA synthetase
MADKSAEDLKDELDALDAEVRKQGAHVRQLKKDGASANEIGEATKTLQALKSRASTLSQQIDTNVPTFNRKSFDDLIIRKMFIVPSFEIHGGVKGLFDLGPPACALKVSMKFLVNSRCLQFVVSVSGRASQPRYLWLRLAGLYDRYLEEALRTG